MRNDSDERAHRLVLSLVVAGSMLATAVGLAVLVTAAGVLARLAVGLGARLHLPAGQGPWLAGLAGWLLLVASGMRPTPQAPAGRR